MLPQVLIANEHTMANHELLTLRHWCLPIQLLQIARQLVRADTHEGLTAARPQHSAAAIAFLISRNQCAFVSQAGPWHRLPERVGAQFVYSSRLAYRCRAIYLTTATLRNSTRRPILRSEKRTGIRARKFIGFSISLKLQRAIARGPASNFRGPFGRAFSMFANAIRNVRAPFRHRWCEIF